MPLSDYSISVNAAARQSFGSIGVESATATFATGPTASFSLGFAREFSAADVIPPLSRCEVFSPPGLRVFAGYATKLPRSATGSAAAQGVTLLGPEWLLGRYSYTSSFTFDDTAATSGQNFFPISARQTGFNLENEKISVKTEIEQVADFIESKLPAGSVYVDSLGLPLLPCPPMVRSGQDCLSALRTPLAIAPSYLPVWDFSPAIPRLWFSHPSDLIPRSILAGDFDGLTLEPRYDLLVRKVTIQIVTDAGNGGVLTTWAKPQTIVSEAALGFGELVVTFYTPFRYGLPEEILDLFTRNQARLRGQPDPRTTGLNLAELLHEPWKTVYYDVQGSVVGQDCDWSLTPGTLLRYDSPGPYQGATAVLQSVTHTLGTGTTQFRAGPPNHLAAPDAFKVQLNQNRRSQKPTSKKEGGSDPATGGGGGSPPAPQGVRFYLVANGRPAYVDFDPSFLMDGPTAV